MKKPTFLAALLLTAAAASGATLTENIDRTFDVKPGASVSLRNVNGSVTVASWDQPRVRVVAEKKVNGSREAAKDVLKELRVDIQAKDGGLVVDTKYPNDEGISSFFDWLKGDRVNAEVKYEVTVPRSMNLDISTVNGAIRVSEVGGRLELDTTNGGIETRKCSGSLDASTTNGGIAAELTSVARGQEINASTTNGRISLAVPKSFAGQVDAGTTNGSISSDLPVAATRSGDNYLRGAINGGGPNVKLRTTNGRIEIKTLN